jgi:hypothetical protein
MKKGGKKYIIYVVSNSYVSSSFYLKVVSQPMWRVSTAYAEVLLDTDGSMKWHRQKKQA